MLVDETPSAPGGAGGYVFDQDGIEATLTAWKRLELDLEDDRDAVRSLGTILAPGNEPASFNMAIRGVSSGQAFEAHNESMRQFVRAYIENLENARTTYLNTEGSARRTFHGQVS